MAEKLEISQVSLNGTLDNSTVWFPELSQERKLMISEERERILGRGENTIVVKIFTRVS